MIQLINNGVTISVTPLELDWYLNAGYERIKPVDEDAQSAKEAPMTDKTLAELRNEAKALGLSGYSALNKNDLFALIESEKDGE